MKHLLPTLLLAAALPAFAADAPADTAPAADKIVETRTVATPDGFPFAIEAQILPENGYRLKITDKTTGKVQITQEEVAPSSGQAGRCQPRLQRRRPSRYCRAD